MKAVTKDFQLTFDELMFKVGDVITSMTRDQAEFITRGVTVLDRNAFEAEGDAFEIFPNDEYYQADVSLEVKGKNTAREQSSKMIRRLSGYVQQQWGATSPQYKKLGIKEFANKSDKAFITIARQVALVCEGYLATLSVIGLTQGQIDDLRAEAQIMEDKLHGVFEATEIRDSKTQERTILANELFAKLRKYCDIGKLIWEDIDEAKYNDYIIYKTTATSLSKPQNLQGNIIPGPPQQVNLLWNPVVDASEYEVYQSQVSIGSPAGEFSHLETVFAPNYTGDLLNGFRFYYKVRAKNETSQSIFSDEVWVEQPI